MEKCKKLIVLTILASALGPVAGVYAMDAASVAKAMEAGEEERKDEVAQIIRLTDEQKALLNKRLLDAAKSGDEDGVNAALGDGADVDVVDEEGRASLHCAVFRGDVKVVKLLLNKNANANAVSNDGYVPLSVAVTCSNYKMAQLLLEHDLDVNVRDGEGYTPLVWAAFKGYIALVDMFLKRGADVNVAGNDGNSALHFAVIRNHKEIVEMLIAAGADFKFFNNQEVTAFDIAKSEEMVQVMAHARAARVRKEETVRVAQRDIIDLSVMLALSANTQDQWLIPWLLRLDLQADEHGGACSICATSFVERVISDGVELQRATQACLHLVCDECAQLQYRAQVAPDSDRNRGIYLGQNADGSERWFLPGRINLSRCPECRAEQNGPTFVPTVAQQWQFEALKEEFKEHELARRLSVMLKRTNALRRFLPEAGIIELVDEYAAASLAVARDQE